MPRTSDEHVGRSLNALKDFQRATVDVAYDNLFDNGQRRMLVADEVGLGKTIVAKGVIARRIADKIRAGDSTPLSVTYICSNQVIAQENVGKLDIYPDQTSHDQFASRLTYLAFQPKSGGNRLLRLNTLTPATSFNTGGGTGQQEERRILYSLLMHDDELSRQGKAVAAMLRAGVRKKPSDWYQELENQRDTRCEKPLRPCCPGRYLAAIRKKRLKNSALSLSLYEEVAKLSKLLTLKNFGQYRQESDRLVRELKEALSEVCVEYIDADIYILDEFQRFKELVDRGSESEAAKIARRIFAKDKARILLLSATPFKAYTGDSPGESGEEHYKEFRTILDFLFDGDEHALREYEAHRQALFKQLLELAAKPDAIDTSHRDAVQNVLRRVICRTERLSVSTDFNAMTVDKWQSQPLQVAAGDIQNFMATDKVVRALNDIDAHTAHPLQAPVEFCKSAPFPLSFLDDYKLKQQLRARKQRAAVRKALRESSAAWINHRSVDRYQSFLEAGQSPPSAKLAQVLNEAVGERGAQLLWIPPSLPCYPLGGVFAESDGFSKTLIFSAWLMAPRMLSTLISYEVERRAIGNPASVDPQEKEARKYFHAKAERRHPIPQLVFSQKRTESGESANNMSNFALLYPSHALAGAFDPKKALVEGMSLADARTQVAARIRQLIDNANLGRFATAAGEEDRWYWAAPLLLDRETPAVKKHLAEWLRRDWNDSDFFSTNEGGRGEKEQSSSKEKHFEEFRQCFEHPQRAGLGPLPPDLAEVLADMAIASPAIVALRCVSEEYAPNFDDRMLFAFDLAGELFSLFNKPESIAAIRITTAKAAYWRRVLQYCLDGCFQSVLDEFMHLLKADCQSHWDAYSRLFNSMNLGTASIKVDDLSSFLKNKRRNMRCHYAVDLGNQRVETEEGQNRIKGIRHNFNSPFRPFVLATTSIGQEGLDFHTYCRKIVHWNLPSNPIDFEQREGRINRFKGLVIRQQIAGKYRARLAASMVSKTGVWDALFRVAAEQERLGDGKNDLIPFWHVETDKYKIERIIPFYPFSRDRAKLTTLLKTLAVYRLAFGQPRQAELVEHLLTNIPDSHINEIRDKLMIDLSPISYGYVARCPPPP